MRSINKKKNFLHRRYGSPLPRSSPSRGQGEGESPCAVYTSPHWTSHKPFNQGMHSYTVTMKVHIGTRCLSEINATITLFLCANRKDTNVYGVRPVALVRLVACGILCIIRVCLTSNRNKRLYKGPTSQMQQYLCCKIFQLTYSSLKYV